MSVSTSLRLLVIGGLVLAGVHALFSASGDAHLKSGVSTEPWLKNDVPYVATHDDDLNFKENQDVVDLELSPGAPIQLLVSSLGSSQTVDEATARIDSIDGDPRYRPVPLPVRTSVAGAITDFDSLRQASLTIPRGPGDSTDSSLDEETPSTHKEFWLHVTSDPLESPRGYQRVQADLACFRKSVQVYVDHTVRNQSSVLLEAEQIAELLDREVLPAIQLNLGRIKHVDQDRRLTVLMTPWLGRLRGGTTQVNGFVRGTDFRIDLPPPFSNHAAILYLNVDLPGGPGLKTLLLHEVAHAAIFSRSQQASNRSGIDDWLNEGLAHLCERQFGGDWSNLDYRIARFHQSPESAPLIVSDYYRASRWRDHKCRGAAFLFLEHQFQQYADQSPEQQSRTSGGLSHWPEWSHQGVDFDKIFRDWTLALARNSTHDSKRRKTGRYLNSGPRFHVWNVDEQRELPLKVSGTATMFVELHSNQRGWYRLRIPHRNVQSRWQITILKPESGRPEVTLEAQWKPPTAAMIGVTSSDPLWRSPQHLVVSLRGHLPPEWHWEALACEPIDGDQARVQKWGHEEIIAASQKLETGLPGVNIVLGLADPESDSRRVLKAKLVGPDGQIAWIWREVPDCNEMRITMDSRTQVRPD